MDITYWRQNRFYVNPSVQCTNNCLFCVRRFQDGVYGFNLVGDANPTSKEIRTAIENTWNSRFTDAAIVGFGEPLLNLDGSLEAIRTLRELSDVEVRMDTNGQASLIHPNREVAMELSDAGLQKIQISLNAPSADIYDVLCHSEFGTSAYDVILQFARKCMKSMHVTLSVVDVPGLDIAACRKIAEKMQVDFRIRDFKGPPELADNISQKLREN